MRRYDLVKKDGDFWELYFFDEEFNCWEFIKRYNSKQTTIKEIYDFIESNNNLYYNIIMKFVF